MSAWDYEDLWLKAKLFLNRATDNDGGRSFDEQAFWASQALELLGKAALARVHPTLIAMPSDDGVHVLVASGLVDGEARFMSIAAKTVFERCARAFRPFDKVEAMRFANARNEYVHSGAVGFGSLPAAAWWPRYWSLAAILINAMDRDIEDLVGATRVPVVHAHLEQNKKNVEQRVEMLIERARQRLTQHRSGSMTTKAAAEWQPGLELRAGLAFSSSEPCPACGAEGRLEGESVQGSRNEYEQYSEDDFEVTTFVTVLGEWFSCSNCGLVLAGPELAQTDITEEFETVDEYGRYDDGPEYGND